MGRGALPRVKNGVRILDSWTFWKLGFWLRRSRAKRDEGGGYKFYTMKGVNQQ